MSLTARDASVIWHPYTQMATAALPTAIVAAKGAYLYTEDGRQLIDAISSWWVITHGHSHPAITSAVAAQMEKLDQVIFAGFTHEPAVTLAEKLLKCLPANQDKVFYTDNGSTAVEVALKMCIQYWVNSGKARKKVLAFENGYHGDTFGAMSVSARGAWTAPFAPFMFEVVFILLPTPENLPAIKAQISDMADEIACFIYEPLVQGSAGMVMYGAAELDSLMGHCLKEGVLLIQDEVFTGFGRTGKNFAADHLSHQPDIMCFSKGLTGGLMPLGITTCTKALYNAFLSQDKLKTLFHGHSFTANPLACAAAAASLDLLMEAAAQENIGRICRQHAAFAEKIAGHPALKDLRQCGTILAFEFNSAGGTSYFSGLRDLLYQFFLDKGVLMRPLGNVIYILPPYCLSDDDLSRIYSLIVAALDKFSL